jgi:hypothetical protein
VLRLLGAELRHDHREMAHTLRKPASTTYPGPERPPAPPVPPPARPPVPPSAPPSAPEPARPQGQGCLFALSQLPLIGFLAFIAMLLLAAAVHDLFFL